MFIHPIRSVQLGINTMFAFEKVFKDEKVGPLEFMIRKQVKSNQALRLRTFIDVRRWRRSDDYLEGRNENLDNLSVFGLSFGKEWQVSLYRKWHGYYGMDLEVATESKKNRGIFRL
jgi:hypothetical protein